MDFQRTIRRLLYSLRSFFFPPFCFDCGAAVDDYDEFCELCMNLILEEEIPAVYERYDHGVSRFYSCFTFEESLIKRVIHALKYNGFPAPAQQLLKTRLHNMDLPDYSAVVPVPLHWRRQNWRGYNQAQLLAEVICEQMGYELLLPVRRVKNTHTQTRKKRWERKGAMRTVFDMKKGDFDLNGKSVLLVDDVFTTGATADECANVLKSAGVVSVDLLTLARA